MITLDEIFRRVLVDSGQFLVPSEVIEMDRDKFLVLVRSKVRIYNKNHPHEKRFNLDMQDRALTFEASDMSDEDCPNHGTRDVLGNPVGIPDSIVDVVPVRISGISPFFLREFSENKSPFLNNPTEFPWEYRKPTLYVPIQGNMDVHAIYNHKIEENTSLSKDHKDYYFIDTLDEIHHDVFFDLVTGGFLKGLGRSRRAFTVQELPITTDAETLVEEGKEMEERAREQLYEEDSKWYLAWR